MAGKDYLADNTLVFVIVLIVLVLIISAIIACQCYRLCGRSCESEIQCRKKLCGCIRRANGWSDNEMCNFEDRGYRSASHSPQKPESDYSQRSSEDASRDIVLVRPEYIASVYTDDLGDDDVQPLQHLRMLGPLTSTHLSLPELDIFDDFSSFSTTAVLPLIGGIRSTGLPRLPRLDSHDNPHRWGPILLRGQPEGASFRVKNMTNLVDEPGKLPVSGPVRTTTLSGKWSEPANDGTQSAGNDQLIDSDLHELMVPDMKESVVKEVRSKPIMFISRRIDEKGGTLVLDNMGIFLTVPPGAIEPGKPEIIFLALNWDLKDLPQMTPNQTIVSPVIQVGPHGLKLKRQATLSFGHCAFNANQVKVYSSETHLMQDKKWSATIGDEEGGTSSHRVLKKECQVYLSHFTLFTCIAEGEAVKKWLQVAAFGKMIGSQFEIRVHLLNGTPSALQFAVENEKKFQYEQMKIPQEYLFCDDMTNMILKVESISEGWSSNVEEMQEEIPFLSIWHGKSPFASFVFKMLNRETEEINTTISARQGDGSKLQLKLLKEIRQKQREGTNSRNKSVENEDHVSIASSKCVGFVQGLVSQDYVPRSHAALQMASPVLPGEETSLVPPSSGFDRAPTSSERPTHVIPHKLKIKLVELMDPPKAAGNDWRMIASELEVDSKIDFLGIQNSPFQEVLGIMQGMRKDLGWLKETLILHERIDAADVITQYLETTGSD